MKSDSWSPDQYHKFKNERSQPFFDLLEGIDRTHSIDTAIDLGCGSGELTKILHETLSCARTLGIDTSLLMLENTKKNMPHGLTFQQGDIARFYQPSTYDLIFSNAAIQWVPHHIQIFENIRKSLKSNGQLAIQMPLNHDYSTHTTANTMTREEPYKSWLLHHGGERKDFMLKAEDYSELLFNLGFKEQRVVVKVYPHVLESREQVVEWVKGTLLTYFKSRLSPDQYESFLTEFRRRLFAQLADTRPFFYPFKRVLIWARLP